MAEFENIRINGARVLVKEEKLTDELSSGIIMPGRSKEQTNKGTVVMVGDGAMLENGTKVPVQVSVGERVVYSSFSGSPVKVNANDEDTYLILNERDILCVIQE
jgi:chaperonin GroES